MIESYLDLLLAQNLADAAFLTLYVPPFGGSSLFPCSSGPRGGSCPFGADVLLPPFAGWEKRDYCMLEGPLS